MQLQNLAIFVCPNCAGSLTPNATSGTPATIACTQCRTPYPLIDGMPCLLPGQDIDVGTQRAFGRQWILQDEGSFERETIYGETAEAELQSFLDRFGIRSKEELRGKHILDIGCGSGRLTRNLALYAPEAMVVGGDLSDAARIAHRRCRDLPNAVVAQLDCLRPPFAAGTFDYIYADGILPAVPALEPALASLDRLMRPGGKLFAWVYPRTFSPYRLIRDVLVRPDRLPLGVQRSIEWTAGLPLWAAFKIWEPLRGPRRRSLGEVIFTLHDNLAPPNQHRRRPAEMMAALQRLGYTQVQALPPHTGIVGTKQEGSSLGAVAPARAGHG